MLPQTDTIVETQSQVVPFEGFDDSTYDKIPRNFIRFYMQDLSESELRVIFYIFDHTLGYCDQAGGRKQADAISRSQFLEGVRRADGTVVDRGAGVSERSLNRALNGLEKRGYITRERRTSASGRPATTVYRPVMKQESKVGGQKEPEALDQKTIHNRAQVNLPLLRPGRSARPRLLNRPKLRQFRPICPRLTPAICPIQKRI